MGAAISDVIKIDPSGMPQLKLYHSHGIKLQLLLFQFS